MEVHVFEGDLVRLYGKGSTGFVCSVGEFVFRKGVAALTRMGSVVVKEGFQVCLDSNNFEPVKSVAGALSCSGTTCTTSTSLANGGTSLRGAVATSGGDSFAAVSTG